MNIENFSLAWRWTNSSHAKFPKEILSQLHPLSVEVANQIADSIPTDFPAGAVRINTSDNDDLTNQWLSKVQVNSERVIISWDRDTALTLPWSLFCEYWDDFCYPASDDADFFLENGQHFLRWSHYEVFQCDSSVL